MDVSPSPEQAKEIEKSAKKWCRPNRPFCPTSPGYGSRGNTFNGDIAWVQIDLGTDDHDHLISPQERFKVAMAHR